MAMEILAAGAAQLGLALAPAQLQAFDLYYHQLIDWNRRVNLTAITDPNEVQVKHFLDSLSCLLAMGAPDEEPAEGRVSPRVLGLSARVIDVGSGAGFPGLPLKIACPSLRLTLLDSAHKRTAFLRHLVALLGLAGVEVVTARAEEAARDQAHREAYDFAVSRAVSALPVLAEYCLPFLKIGGRLIAQKKGDLAAEIGAAQEAIALLGGSWRGLQRVNLPLLPGGRQLLLVDKMAPTPPSYPRRPGLPEKRPLGHRG